MINSDYPHQQMQNASAHYANRSILERLRSLYHCDNLIPPVQQRLQPSNYQRPPIPESSFQHPTASPNNFYANNLNNQHQANIIYNGHYNATILNSQQSNFNSDINIRLQGIQQQVLQDRRCYPSENRPDQINHWVNTSSNDVNNVTMLSRNRNSSSLEENGLNIYPPVVDYTTNNATTNSTLKRPYSMVNNDLPQDIRGNSSSLEKNVLNIYPPVVDYTTNNATTNSPLKRPYSMVNNDLPHDIRGNSSSLEKNILNNCPPLVDYTTNNATTNSTLKRPYSMVNNDLPHDIRGNSSSLEKNILNNCPPLVDYTTNNATTNSTLKHTLSMANEDLPHVMKNITQYPIISVNSGELQNSTIPLLTSQNDINSNFNFSTREEPIFNSLTRTHLDDPNLKKKASYMELKKLKYSIDPKNHTTSCNSDTAKTISDENFQHYVLEKSQIFSILLDNSSTVSSSNFHQNNTHTGFNQLCDVITQTTKVGKDMTPNINQKESNKTSSVESPKTKTRIKRTLSRQNHNNLKLESQEIDQNRSYKGPYQMFYKKTLLMKAANEMRKIQSDVNSSPTSNMEVNDELRIEKVKSGNADINSHPENNKEISNESNCKHGIFDKLSEVSLQASSIKSINTNTTITEESDVSDAVSSKKCINNENILESPYEPNISFISQSQERDFENVSFLIPLENTSMSTDNAITMPQENSNFKYEITILKINESMKINVEIRTDESLADIKDNDIHEENPQSILETNFANHDSIARINYVFEENADQKLSDKSKELQTELGSLSTDTDNIARTNTECKKRIAQTKLQNEINNNTCVHSENKVDSNVLIASGKENSYTRNNSMNTKKKFTKNQKLRSRNSEAESVNNKEISYNDMPLLKPASKVNSCESTKTSSKSTTNNDNSNKIIQNNDTYDEFRGISTEVENYNKKGHEEVRKNEKRREKGKGEKKEERRSATATDKNYNYKPKPDNVIGKIAKEVKAPSFSIKNELFQPDKLDYMEKCCRTYFLTKIAYMAHLRTHNERKTVNQGTFSEPNISTSNQIGEKTTDLTADQKRSPDEGNVHLQIGEYAVDSKSDEPLFKIKRDPKKRSSEMFKKPGVLNQNKTKNENAMMGESLFNVCIKCGHACLSNTELTKHFASCTTEKS